ncbi:TCP-1/cpn60 chaperonin family protein [Chlamydia ibidis]|uniref:60 kDa chaperonin n=2 Tax=Chlamydia ibidis TaxID=1405396 RepID=S7KEM1_9CHLA|nr:chaperonin GroEL [Chlamydia ibidis]EPP34636.1 TCP-1/cpn60 chaperonin family protein [Chlamydia ibidis]EQM63111.1 TCP-1/cpn60 chaperonin family protein [Chlamydia ibidis 10-1398/6]
MSKLFKNKLEGLQALQRGIHNLSKIICPTLGPQGCQAIIKNGSSIPYTTKNGAIIAQEFLLPEKTENVGAKLIKQVAQQTRTQVGDGATTTIILAEALFSQSLKGIELGIDPLDIRQGITLATGQLLQELENNKYILDSPEDIFRTAKVSTNYDAEITELVTKLLETAGPYGKISVMESAHHKYPLISTAHTEIDIGYASPYFVTDPEDMEVVYHNVYVLLCQQSLSSLNESFIHFLEKVAQEEKYPLIIIAEDFDPQILATLAVNKIRGGLPICALKTTQSANNINLEDISVLTGASIVGNISGDSFDNVSLGVLGFANKVLITRNSIIFSKGHGDREKIAKHILTLHQANQFSVQQTDNLLEQRLSYFLGNKTNIYLAKEENQQFKNKKLFLKEAIQATKIAISGGVVVGGGIALMRSALSLSIPKDLSPGIAYGYKVILETAKIPLKVILKNCGQYTDYNWNIIVEHSDKHFGYNAVNEQFETLMNAKVFDPLLVVQTTLRNAVSISNLLLMT